MTQLGVGDFPINPASTSGDELATILNRLQRDYYSSAMGPSRPPLAENGTYWINDSAAPVLVLYLFDGANDIKIGEYNTTTSVFQFDNVGSTVFFTSSTAAPTSQKSGDFWYQTDRERLFVWDGTAWRAFNIVVYLRPSGSPPPSPQLGEFWLQSDTGQTYIWDQSDWGWIAGEVTEVVNIWTKQQFYAAVSKSSPTADINFNEEPYVQLDLSANTTINFLALNAGKTLIVESFNSSGSSHNLTWTGGVIRWATGVDFSTGPNSGDVKIFTFFIGAGNTIRGNVGWEGAQ